MRPVLLLFRKGQKVKLKAGGQIMTCEDYEWMASPLPGSSQSGAKRKNTVYSGRVECTWTDPYNSQCTGFFYEDELEAVLDSFVD